jgi:hypothetical protein
MRNLLFFFVALTLTLTPSNCRSGPKEISREQAHQLVLTVLESQGFDIKSPDLVVEDRPDDPDMPGFYEFGAYTRNEGMNLSAGAYAVGRRTAEVWNWMHCWRFTRAKRVRALQKHLRREIGLSESELRTLSAKRPFCFSIPMTEH